MRQYGAGSGSEPAPLNSVATAPGAVPMLKGDIPMFRKTLCLRLLPILPLIVVTTAFAAENGPQVVYLWPSGAPTLQGAGEKEITNPPQPQSGQVIRQIKNIHNPAIEVFLPPPEKATGAALIVAAGGGHRELNVGTEGYDLREWLHGL